MPLSSLSVVVRVLPVPVGPTHNTWAKRERRRGKGRSEDGKKVLHSYVPNATTVNKKRYTDMYWRDCM